MEYRQGAFGRVFLARFEDGDDLLAGLKDIARRESVRAGLITLLGGMRSAGVVTGPRQPVIPPEPVWAEFSDGREVIGTGSLFWSGDDPIVHLHGAIGRGGSAIVGCIRKDAAVYLVVEAVVAEIVGLHAAKAFDERTGLLSLTFAGKDL